jgi:hypothetical protein
MLGVLAQVQEVSFPPSVFVPLAVGFFGLGTGYLIYGPQELFKLPGRDRAVDLITGIWGIWMPGSLQFLTGVILFVGVGVAALVPGAGAVHGGAGVHRLRGALVGAGHGQGPGW